MSVSDRLAGVDADRLHLALMLALTFSTGVVDAVGYLGLDRVFTGNMTGNVVLLGMALTGTTSLPILRPLLALGFFLAGAVVGSRLVRRQDGWSGRVTVTLWIIATLLTAIAALLAFALHLAPETVGTIATSALGFAMGMQAALARRVKVAEVTTVVVTSTLTGLAADSRLAGGTGALWLRRALAVVLISAGAAAGALALLVNVALGVLVSAAVTIVVASLGHTGHRARSAGQEPAAD
ncbi:YoaK family protein [Leifsonia sp. TF02-11]|uniref:YoaK family protein n=1 Tax=Leifsonia sp. TF02-11 TaxID=2815212 RepID=UPI0027DB39EE|nr:YoaK family protein [Leifsonia sp. TF02-11]